MGAFSAHNNQLLQPSEQVFAKPAILPSYVFGCVCVLHVCVCVPVACFAYFSVQT